MGFFPDQAQVKRYWINDGPKAVFITLYMFANVAVFIERFFAYLNTPAFGVLGYAICFAKGAAATLKLNCAFILLTVIRNILTWLRSTWVNTYLPIDKNIIFHKLLAFLIAVGTIIHAMAHYINYLRLSHAPLKTLTSLSPLLTAVPTISGLCYTSIPGATGHLVVMIMIFMYTTAIESIRRPLFELFWFTHHLFIFFFALLMLHGFPGVFGPPSFWCWVVGPLFLYLVERATRVMRGKQTTMLHLARQHPAKVIELRLKKQTFVYKPGQYLFLNCPYIAPNEWHPFTITSAPHEDFVSVHINIVGNWTGGVANLLNPEKKIGIVQQDLLEAPNGLPIFRIDGPFGAASEEVFDYKVVMLIGAGIGVTPFASILKHIKFQLERQMQLGQVTLPLEKVYFFWVCRDKGSFGWFSALLSALEKENVNNFLEINTYLTGALSAQEVRDVMYTDEENQDAITGLSSHTNIGRPKWPDIFKETARKHRDTDVGVFFCGPRVLSKDLYKNCREFTTAGPEGARFHYNKENF
eukprot:TRINITY_DN0_c1_g1_i1.p1 TRINITY_DN0_c1_g1~~TRINITY_DN0_c1_g1_i1.p1  ORF type:complete len:525 (+),score=105.37 TRINITY_DN0_c1_g1_i1:195-1769(+)